MANYEYNLVFVLNTIPLNVEYANYFALKWGKHVKLWIVGIFIFVYEVSASRALRKVLDAKLLTLHSGLFIIIW